VQRCAGGLAQRYCFDELLVVNMVDSLTHPKTMNRLPGNFTESMRL